MTPDQKAALDESAFDHFVEIPCDKCGTVSAYAPHTVDQVTECFGCTCKRLNEMKITCSCGWQGNYFDQEVEFDSPKAPKGRLDFRKCPQCGKDGYNE